MPTKILMPALSPTMTEGTLASWHKNEGDTVEIGDVIAEIETDKATMEVEAVDEGVLGKILVSAGTENVPVNEPIALLLEEGEDVSAAQSAGDGGDRPSGQKGAPGGQAKADDAPAQTLPPSTVNASPSTSVSSAADAGGKAPPAPRDTHGRRVPASPLARRIASQHGLDLTQLQGSGPGGRIVRADVETAVQQGTPGKAAAPPTARPDTAAQQPAAAPTGAAATPPSGPDARAVADAAGIPYTERKNNQMRKVIARRLSESKQTVPHFYLSVDCELDNLLDLRKKLNDKGANDGVKLSVNDLVIKAAAAALRKVPDANAAWTDDAVLLFDRVDISVAVATDSGLITPIIKDAASKGLATISAEMKDLAGRARDGKLKPEEFQGGTFSISNLGMFGIDSFSAIINPPQGCILAVGRGEQRPVVRDGAVAVATMMTCTLSVDHRVVDGAVGAEYLAAFRKLIEEPLGLML